MTDLTALDELIKAVKAGGGYDLGPFKCLGHDDIESSLGIYTTRATAAWMAYRGSLDAAKALHDALVPGYGYRVSPCYAIVLKLNMYGDDDGFDATTNEMPARAWLLAVLRAYRAQIGGAA